MLCKRTIIENCALKERRQEREGRKQQEDMRSEQKETGVGFALLTVCNLGNTRAC